MLQKILTSKKFLIGLGILTLVTLTTSLIGSKNKTPMIISSSPPNNAINFGVISSVELNFDMPIRSSDLTVSSTPDSDWKIDQKENDSIIISHTKTLETRTPYTLNIYWKGKSINSIKFTTEATQTDYKLIKKITNEVNRDYPLSLFTPYETSQYSVVYLSPLNLGITIKNPNLTSQEAIDEIKTWVKKNGGDVEAHKYTTTSGNVSPKPSSGSLSTSPLR